MPEKDGQDSVRNGGKRNIEEEQDSRFDRFGAGRMEIARGRTVDFVQLHFSQKFKMGCDRENPLVFMIKFN
jgi:hypothetical protein